MTHKEHAKELLVILLENAIDSDDCGFDDYEDSHRFVDEIIQAAIEEIERREAEKKEL